MSENAKHPHPGTRAAGIRPGQRFQVAKVYGGGSGAPARFALTPIAEYGPMPVAADVLAPESAVNAAKHEIERLRREMWGAFCAVGEDPDGDGPEHLQPGELLAAVKSLRARADEDHVH